MKRAAAILIITIAGISTGCAHSAGRICTGDDWHRAREGLGRVAVLTRFGWEGMDRDKLTRASRCALEELPNTEIVDSGSLIAELGNPDDDTPISDYDIIVAARKLNIDTVCTITLDRCTTQAVLGMQIMPPVPTWEQSNHLAYDVRVLDVASGKLLVRAYRKRTRLGVSMRKLHEKLPDELAEDLRIVLSANHGEQTWNE